MQNILSRATLDEGQQFSVVIKSTPTNVDLALNFSSPRLYLVPDLFLDLYVRFDFDFHTVEPFEISLLSIVNFFLFHIPERGHAAD